MCIPQAAFPQSLDVVREVPDGASWSRLASDRPGPIRHFRLGSKREDGSRIFGLSPSRTSKLRRIISPACQPVASARQDYRLSSQDRRWRDFRWRVRLGGLAFEAPRALSDAGVYLQQNSRVKLNANEKG
jgi:hypothetical protein